MIKYYEEKFPFIMKKKDLGFMDLSNLRYKYKLIMRDLFEEECVVYIEYTDVLNYLLEVHFQDCNFYEIKFSINDVEEVIITKIFNM